MLEDAKFTSNNYTKQYEHLKLKVCSSTSFLYHQRPHVPPAEAEGHLAAQTLQQVLGGVLQVERTFVLEEENSH